MNKIITIIIFGIFTNILTSQVWEELNRPYPQLGLGNLYQINGILYTDGVENENVGKIVQVEYDGEKWEPAKDRMIYEEFGKTSYCNQRGSDILLVCRNGIYISLDSAKTWLKQPYLTFGTESNSWNKIEDASINDEYIYAVTDYAFDKGISRYNKSTNSWDWLKDKRKDTTLDMFVQQIELNSTHVFAMQEKIVHPLVSNDSLSGGLYISEDKGETWDKTLVDSALYSIFANDEVVMAMTNYGNLLRSEDNGKTWTVKGIGTAIILYLEESDRILAVSNPEGILESKDMGKTWKVLNKTVPSTNLFRFNDKYYYSFISSLYTSDVHFKEAKKIKMEFTYRSIQSLHKYKDTIFATGSFNRGLVYTADEGQSWHTYSHYLDSLLVNFSSKLIIKDDIFIGAENTRNLESLFISEDNFNTFYYSAFFGDFIKDLIFLDNKRILINGQNIRISDDMGRTYKYLDTSVIKSSYKTDKLVKLSTGELLIFAGFQKGVFRSKDDGDSWVKIADSLSVEGLGYARVNSFYEFGEELFVRVNADGVILKSTDRGVSWNNVELDEELLSKTKYNDIVMVSPDIMFDNVYGSGEYDGLYYSVNTGKNFIKMDLSSILPERKTFSSYRIIGIIDDYLYLSTLLNQDSTETPNYNLYRTSFANLGISTNVKNTEQKNLDYNAYPQPGKDQITVELYTGSLSEFPQIEIYNSEGRLLLSNNTITMERMNWDQLKLTWNCAGVANGVYLISVDSGSVKQSVKVVVGK